LTKAFIRRELKVSGLNLKELFMKDTGFPKNFGYWVFPTVYLGMKLIDANVIICFLTRYVRRLNFKPFLQPAFLFIFRTSNMKKIEFTGIEDSISFCTSHCTIKSLEDTECSSSDAGASLAFMAPACKEILAPPPLYT
jgi:hypothetical protein